MIKPAIAPVSTDQGAVTGEEICGVNREFGECGLGIAGCRPLIDLLHFIHPPFSVLALLRAQRSELPADALAWLRRIEENLGPGVGHRWR